MEKIAVESSLGTPSTDDKANEIVSRNFTVEPAGASKPFTFAVTHHDQVLREFLKVDEEKLRAAIDAGLRATPGIRIFEV